MGASENGVSNLEMWVNVRSLFQTKIHNFSRDEVESLSVIGIYVTNNHCYCCCYRIMILPGRGVYR